MGQVFPLRRPPLRRLFRRYGSRRNGTFFLEKNCPIKKTFFGAMGVGVMEVGVMGIYLQCCIHLCERFVFKDFYFKDMQRSTVGSWSTFLKILCNSMLRSDSVKTLFRTTFISFRLNLQDISLEYQRIVTVHSLTGQKVLYTYIPKYSVLKSY